MTSFGNSLDDMKSFETTLAPLPHAMVVGPECNPVAPSENLFDLNGVIRWELLTKQALWTNHSEAPKRESEGFLWSMQYLYRYSKVINSYWLAMTKEEYESRYGHIFRAFTLDTSLPHRLIDYIKEGLESKPEASLLVVKIICSWYEKILYLMAQLFDPNLQLRDVVVVDRFLDDDASSSTTTENRKEPMSDGGLKQRRKEDLKAGQNERSEGVTDAEEQRKAITFKTLKMKQILSARELREKLGEDRTYLLRLLIGPLHGANLRNLTWHGFITSHEWPSYYTGLLYGILLSLALEWQPTITQPYYAENLAKLQSKMDFFIPYILSTSSVLTQSTIPNPISTQATVSAPNRMDQIIEMCHFQRERIVKLICTSKFVPNGSRTEWAYGMDLLINRRFYESMVVFFPLLEASLRRLYVEVNNIQSFRLCAEPDTLCLSLDLILEEWLDREILIQDKRSQTRLASEMKMYDSKVPKGAAEITSSATATDDGAEEEDGDEMMAIEEDGKLVNKIFERMGPNNCAILFDLLIWADTMGIRRHYRPRDQLAHGNALPCHVSSASAIHLFLSLLNFMQLEDGSPVLNARNNGLSPDILMLARQFADSYQPCFHRKRTTIDNYCKMVDYVERWKGRCEDLLTPQTTKLIQDGIQKEKREEELKHEEHMKTRLRETMILKQRLEKAVALKIPGPLVKYDIKGLFPIATPITFKCLIQLIHISIMLDSLQELLEGIFTKLNLLRDEVVARTAWLADRRQFVGLLATVPVMEAISQIILLFVKEMLNHDDYAQSVNFVRTDSAVCDFPTFVWTLLRRTHTHFQEGKYKRGEEVLDSMLASVPRIPRLLSRNEGIRSWLDIEGLLIRLERQSKGEILKEYRVFEEPRNALVVALRRRLQGIKGDDSRSASSLSASEYELFLLTHQLGSCISPKGQGSI